MWSVLTWAKEHLLKTEWWGIDSLGNYEKRDVSG